MGFVYGCIDTVCKQTNKLERQTHDTDLRIRRVSPCFVEAASAKADFSIFSVRQRESTDKNEAEGAVVFRHGIITFVATRVDLQAPQTYTSSSIEAANILIKSN